jgi:hypothetical protein
MSYSLADFLWLAGGLTAVWVCLPMLLSILGCTRHRMRVLPARREVEPASEDEEYLFYHRQLGALGFEPLGAIEEKVTCFGFHYLKCFRHCVFVSRERGVYASLYRLFPGDEWRVLLSTLLADGWLIQTGCMECFRCTDEKYLRGGVTTRVVAEQLEAHLEQLRAGWEVGDALAAIDLAALAGRINEVNQSFSRAGLGSTAVGPLGLAVFLLGSLAGLGWLVSPGRHLLVPGGLLLGSLLYRPLMGFLLRWTAQDMRREDVEKRRKQAGVVQPADGPPPASFSGVQSSVAQSATSTSLFAAERVTSRGLDRPGYSCEESGD